MATWKAMAVESYRSALLFRDHGFIRPAISRAYFAAYAAATAFFLDSYSADFKHEANNPGHEQLLQLLRNNLPPREFSEIQRRTVGRSFDRLQKARIDADYNPRASRGDIRHRLTAPRRQAVGDRRAPWRGRSSVCVEGSPFCSHRIGGVLVKTDDARTIESKVNEYLAKRPSLRELGARALPGTAHHEPWGWRVAVGTHHDPARAFDYYDELTVVEEQLRETEQIDVFIGPSGARPPDEETARGS